MRIINAKECAVVALGRLGENEYTVVRFDVSAWITEIPGAVIGLYNQRPGDADAYPIAAIAVEDGVATWTVTSAELTQTGEGRCELVAIAGEVVAKSAIFRTIVFDALDGSGEAPEPWEEWQQQLIILKNEAEQAADRAEEAVEHYPCIVDGVWEVWDSTTEQWISTGVHAQGPQGVPGEQGEPGEPGIQGEPGADGVTFTPSVSPEGVISWTNDGGKPNPQPVNIKGPQGDDYILTAADKAEIAQQAEEFLAPVLDTKAPAIWEDASGSIAHFEDGAEDMPLRECMVQIEPVQEGTGDPSPENVRPITGWTGATISHSGEDTTDPDEISITFPTEAGPVYGGSLNVITGVLTVDRAIIDLGTLTWAATSWGGFRSNNLDGFLPNPDNEKVFGGVAEKYPSMAYADVSNGTIGIEFGSSIRQNAFYAYTGNDVSPTGMAVNFLATPQTYQLTPQEIRTLLGTNNIWADTGDTAVTYPADTKTFIEQNAPESPVQDVQVNGMSVVTDGVANVPIGSTSQLGVVKSTTTSSVNINGTTGVIDARRVLSVNEIKASNSQTLLLAPVWIPSIAFWGLANASGDTTQKASSNAVGNYTESAKSAISTMLNGPVTVSGTTPSITAMPGIQYVCGEVATLDITVPASGIIDVVFESGSTATVLTVTPPTGMTMKWIGEDPTALEANKLYEINIMDGCRGMVVSWT